MVLRGLSFLVVEAGCCREGGVRVEVVYGGEECSQTWAWVIRVEPGASNGGYPTRYNYGWTDTQK